jgi:hypothetical protein
VDPRVDRRFLYETFSLDVYLEVLNTTLSRQVVGFQRQGGELRPEGYRFVLPSVGVRVEL